MDIVEKNYKAYVGNELGVLLDSKFIGREKRIFFHQEPPGVLRGIFVEINRNVYIMIYTNNLERVEQFSMDMTWDMNELRSEKITKIEIFVKDELRASFIQKL